MVNPQLKPSVVGSIDVAMRDGGGNLIREWKRVFTTKGVFAGELEVAMAPVLGDWNITVDVSGQGRNSIHLKTSRELSMKISTKVQFEQEICLNL